MMGMRLASEIKQAIERHFDNSEDVILNFVGHSMGGIIARASL
jgi:surfactin synthase thioesterase subunit